MEKEKRILIVDDDRDFREQLSKHLMNSFKRNETTSLVERVRATLHASSQADERDFTPEPYVIHTASQGKQAYEMVQEAINQGKPYALIFLDVRMPPGWDGVITLEHIWKVDKKVQVVLCSAHSVYSWKEVVERFGKKDNLLILKKPFDTTVVTQIALALTEKYMMERSAEEHESDTEAYLKHIIDGLPAPLILSDSNGKVTYWNQAISEFTHIQRPDTFNRVLWDILPGLEKCGADIREVIITQENITRDSVINLNGQKQKVEVTVYPLGKETEEPRAIVRILTKSDSRGKLSENEYLRTINSINQAINKLKDDLDVDDVMQLKNNIKQDIEKLELLTKDSEEILKKALAETHSDLNETLDDALKDCRDALDDIEIELEHTAPPSDCPIPANQLKLAFWNILVNAAEAIKAGKDIKGKISVRIEKANVLHPMTGLVPEADPGTYWLVKFSDNGVGMDSETVSRIFDPFFTTKSNCGLGLVLVYNILKQNNGHILVESEVNRGSTFSLYLPVK